MRIVEVGPRDGIQNESVSVPTPEKVALIRALAESGLKEIEATSFVSPKWVPQLADAADVWAQLPVGEARYSALVPNMRGLQSALAAGVTRIAVFTAASESFTRRNINMSIAESLAVFADVIREFRVQVPHGWVRGYLSTAFNCPYEGRIEPSQAAEVLHRLLEVGVDEVSIGDTIGVAVPKDVRELTPILLGELPADRFAYHFHDTRGTAIANVAAAMDLGIEIFDSSAAGLGGCPYAPGAGGNLATDDLVYFLEASGVPTGVNAWQLAQASLPVLARLGREPSAKAQVAVLAASQKCT